MIVGWDQCDQMARIFLQYLDIYSNENLPNSVKNCQSRLIFCQALNYTLQTCPKLSEFNYGGEISPNLVTLDETRVLKDWQQNYFRLLGENKAPRAPFTAVWEEVYLGRGYAGSRKESVQYEIKRSQHFVLRAKLDTFSSIIWLRNKIRESLPKLISFLNHYFIVGK